MTATQVLMEGRQIGSTAPTDVDITIREDGQVAWINVDSICVLRIYRPQNPIVVTKRAELLKSTPT